MSAFIDIHGRLGRDPEQRTSAGDKIWASASVAVDLGREAGGPATWFKIIGFGATAEHLAGLHKGDVIAAIGRLQLNRWQTQGGEQREDLEVVVEQLLSARSVRPNGGKRRGDDPARQAPASRMAESAPVPDDEIPF
jgi:single-strand DNA-binding protein